jgi:hypothetical protein
MVSQNNDFRYNDSKYSEGSEPKAGVRTPGVAFFSRKNESSKRSTPVNVDMETFQLVKRKSSIVFTRDQTELDIKKAFFILEGEERFEKLSLRNRMKMVVKKSESELLDWYYELGARDELPKTWDEFKTAVLDFCTRSGLSDKRKFKEERWYEYVRRLADFAELKNY